MTMMMMMTVTAETGVFLLSYDRLTVRALCSFIPGGYTGAAHRAQALAGLSYQTRQAICACSKPHDPVPERSLQCLFAQLPA